MSKCGWRLAWSDKKVSHICSDREEDTRTQTSAPIETEVVVWPPPQ